MISLITSYIMGTTQILLFSQFAKIFLRKNEDTIKMQYAYIFIAPFIWVLLGLIQISELNIVYTFLFSLLTILIGYDGKWLLKLILSLLSVAIAIACDFAVAFTMAGVTGVMDYSDHSLFVQIIMSLSISLLFWIVVWIIRLFSLRRKVKDVPLYINYTSLFLLIITLLFAFYTGTTVQNNNDFISSAFGFICFTLLLLVDLIVIIGNERDYKQLKTENELASMRLQEKYTTKLIESQNIYMSKNASLIHDFKFHLQTITGLIDQTDRSQEVYTYIESINSSLGEVSSFNKVKSNVLRVVLDIIKHECDKFHIKFITEISYSDFDFITFEDICTLFMNGLSNAVEACESMNSDEVKTISLSINRRNAMVFIRIDNTNKNKIIENDSGLVSSKEDSECHGIGIKNMERVVGKYHGSLYYDHTCNKFSLLMLITDDDTPASIPIQGYNW